MRICTELLKNSITKETKTLLMQVHATAQAGLSTEFQFSFSSMTGNTKKQVQVIA
jgi:hypothetical protein